MGASQADFDAQRSQPERISAPCWRGTSAPCALPKGWSQERLALACDLDRTFVSAVERSEWNVFLTTVERLAVALDVETWTLLKPPD